MPFYSDFGSFWNFLAGEKYRKLEWGPGIPPVTLVFCLTGLFEALAVAVYVFWGTVIFFLLIWLYFNLSSLSWLSILYLSAWMSLILTFLWVLLPENTNFDPFVQAGYFFSSSIFGFFVKCVICCRMSLLGTLFVDEYGAFFCLELSRFYRFDFRSMCLFLIVMILIQRFCF